jgi:DNA-binding transcriptional LysR family regulator
MQTKFDWSDIKVLLAFGRAGTLTDAALSLGMDETTAARRLKRLETALGYPLVSREGGKLRLTSTGKIAHERAQAMETAAESIEAIHGTDRSSTAGVVRITSLGYMLNDVVIPALPTFLAMHPGITIHIQSDNRNFDMANGETDVALRMAAPRDTRFAALKVADLAFAAYRPRNRFHGVPPRRCHWIGPDASFAHIPESAWLEANIPPDRIVMRSNANISNAAAVRSGLVCAVLPSIIGDGNKDMVRMEIGVVLRREIWLLHRHDVDPDGAVAAVIGWLKAVFAEIAPQLSG